MMKKVARLGLIERNRTTVDWLVAFEKKLLQREIQRRANLGNLAPIIRRKQYSSIEEKMADIKKRIGFDLSQKFADELDSLNKSGNSCKCEVTTSCACKLKAYAGRKEDDIRKMQNILNFVKDIVKAEPHLSATNIIAKCREDEGLGFNSLKIDHTKLKAYAERLLSSVRKNENEEVKYVSRNEEGNTGVEQAEYYSHADTSLD